MEIQIIDQPKFDPDWDEFLMSQPTGHHLQSSPWGQLKCKFGWQVIRILVRENKAIVGGVQILVRRLPVWGHIGYISKGPVVIPDRVDIIEALFDTIEQEAHSRRLLLLSVQSPADEPLYMQPLQNRHFKPSIYYVVPPTTVLVDLKPTEDEILGRMKKKTRYGIRSASRKNVIVREGTEEDLPVFFKLMQETGLRSSNSYSFYDLLYYQEAWQKFAPLDVMRLFLAYYQDQPLAALMVIGFGQWAVYKWGASADTHRELMPSYLLQWSAIQWAKQKGCRYYDLGGITPVIADALNRGEKINPADSKGAGLAHFKLGFGEIANFPASYDNSYGFRPKWLIRKAIPYAWNSQFLRKLIRGTA